MSFSFATLPPEQRTVGSVQRKIVSLLTPECGSEGEAKAVARLIFETLKGWSATDMVIHAADAVSDFILERIDEITARFLTSEPIQYILGNARFYGMTLSVNPAVLIPRPETEELVDIIVRQAGATPDLKVLDIGTGSGAIAIALARNLRFPEVTAIDISPRAIVTARANAEQLKAKVNFIEADIFQWEPATQSFNIIVSNPPYICINEKGGMQRNVLEHEPHTALFVPDHDPLLFYTRIADVARKALVPGGKLYFEINPIYAAELTEMLAQKGFDDICLHTDISHRNRFVTCIRP